jgi:hypothetical protein
MAICRTREECFQAGADRVKDWELTQRQIERLTVLLRPYVDQLVPAEPAEGDAA